MLIEAKSATIGYGNYIAVKEISVNIAKGEIVTIIGPNGSGKSTVLKALTRLIKYRQGSITIDGEEISVINSREFARRIAVLPQKHQVPPDFKVKDLIAYGRVPHQKWYEKTSGDDEKIIEAVMKRTGVWELRDKSIIECSGGESQRVWIATVLTQDPEILFLDEPTTYLDVSHQLDTMKLIKELNTKSGIGIVMVLHDLSQALQVSDKVVVIKNGEIYAEGKPIEVITPKMMKDVYNVECDIIKLKDRNNPIIAYKEI